MRVVTEHRPADQVDFERQALAALLVLRDQPSFLSGEVGRSPDQPDVWLFTTRWATVGAMRRGLGSFEAKVALGPVMQSATERVSTFEVLFEVTPEGSQSAASDLAESSRV